VTVVNRVAIESLNKTCEEEIIGQHIREILPGAKLSRVLSGGQQHYDQEFEVSGTTMIINTVPMVEKGAYSGAIRPPIPLQSGPPVPEQTGPPIPLQTGPLIPIQSGPLFIV